MDLRQFYKKIREVKETLTSDFILIASAETPDGGRSGVVSEVTRDVAARLLVEGRAVLATAEQAAVFHASGLEARERVERAELARRIQVAIVADSEEKTSNRKPSNR